MRKTGAILSAVMRLASVFALVMLSFAHAPMAREPARIRFAAFILPDGTLPTLCITDLTGTTGKDGKGNTAYKGCEACRLAQSIVLPVPQGIVATASAYSVIVRTLERDYQVRRSLYPPSSGPRAPPFAVILA